MINNDDDLMLSDIDFDKLNEVVSSISEDIANKQNSMSVQEREILDSAKQTASLCNDITSRRKEVEAALSEMTEEETLKYYKKITQTAEDLAFALQLDTVTLEQIENEKLNDKRDD